MKTPPFLLAAALIFWGWQTDFLVPGVIMAVALECPRWFNIRWELSNEDYTRIWTFCWLLLLASAVYAFTANQGPGEFRGFFQNPGPLTTRNAGTASARTASSLFRWLPMIFFLFIASQEYSAREGIPLETISSILRRRWKRARKLGQPVPPSQAVNIAYPYFALCLLAASIQVSEDNSYFLGLCALVGWALWPRRSRRFGLVFWMVSLGTAFLLGYAGQRGIGRLQNYLNNQYPEWLGQFTRHRFDPTQSRTELGRIGRVKTSGTIVLRLEPRNGAPPPLLRETSYRTYKLQTWSAAVSSNDWESVRSETTNETQYVLLRDKPTSSSVKIACYLQGGAGLLPLPTGSGRLENLKAYTLEKNGLGGVLVREGPGLVIFDAHYGPGPTLDSIATDEDLRVPERERSAIEQVISGLGVEGQSAAQKIQSLHKYFLDKFTYSTWQHASGFTRTNETPLSRFLTRTHRGHCEYFATAGVLLLREMKIPARYAVGWAVHEGSAGKFVVRQRDAHAWCLAWDEKTRLWRDVDFTPGSWVEAEHQRASTLEALSDFWSRVSFEISKIRWGQTHLRQYILLGLIPILGVLLSQILFHRRRRHRKDGALGNVGTPSWPGLDSEFYQLELVLSQRGMPRQPGETLSEWFTRALEDPALVESKATASELLRLHYRYRFDPQGLSHGEREGLRLQAIACLARFPRRGTKRD